MVHRDIKPHNILMEELEGDDNGCSSSSISSIGAAGNSGEECGLGGDLSDLGRYLLKISDLGLSKTVSSEEASFAGSASLNLSTPRSSVAVGVSLAAKQHDAVGTVGWQPPEVIRHRRYGAPRAIAAVSAAGGGEFSMLLDDASRRPTSKVDIFSLGCVYHFTLVPGEHPFGAGGDREGNILGNAPRLAALGRTPDALELVRGMILHDPARRPKASEVCCHPFFWNASKRLGFLEAVYNRLKGENERSPLLRSLEKHACAVVCSGISGSDADRTKSYYGWGAVLDAEFKREIENPPHGITYDTGSIFSCLRFIRHKKSHFDELSSKLQRRLSLPEGFVRYFETQLPRLVMYCVWFASQNFDKEKEFEKYSVHVLKKSFFTEQPPDSVIGAASAPAPHASATPTPTAACDMPSTERDDASSEPGRVPAIVMRTLADHSSGDASGLPCRGYYTSSLWTRPTGPPVAIAQADAAKPAAPAGGTWSRGVRVDADSRQALPKKSHSTADHTGIVSSDGIKERVPLICSNVFVPAVPASERPPRVQLAVGNERYKTALCQDWERTGAMLCVKYIRRPPDLLSEIRARREDSSAAIKEAVGVCNWTESTRLRQHCEFRRGMSKCHFAHGPVELRPKGMRTIGATGRLVCGPVVDKWGLDVSIDDCGRFSSGGIDVYRDAKAALTHPPAATATPAVGLKK